MKFYYFNSTHWDREWYQPFEEFRKYLIDATRELLKIYDTTPAFRKFTFDGQTVVLEDICEIRPDWRPRLEKLIRAGKLNVGPWYVMPDEFLVSGEAMIRNFLAGRRIASEFGGKVWPVGYVCDIFGHIAQLPQILAGFGLKGAVVWRGVPGGRGSHLIYWESPDGTRIKTLNLSKRSGYSDFTLNVRGILPLPLDAEAFKQRFRDWVEEDYDEWGDCFVLSDGFDHATPFGETEKLFNCIRELYPDAEIIHTDYTELFDREYNSPDLPVISGEQIHPADGPKNGAWQISATLSSRADVKRANDLCQNMLELLIEPQAAIRATIGDVESLPLLRYTWKHLLKNHAHDSICGCSIDQVHRAVLGRMEEVGNLARTLDEEFRVIDYERVTGKSFLTGIRQSFTDDKEREAVAADGRYTMRLFNPLPHPVGSMRELEIAFPARTIAPYPKLQSEPFGYEFVNSFRLYGGDGEEIPYQLKSITCNQIRSYYRQDHRRYDLYRIICAPQLPAAGWGNIEIRPAQEFVRSFATMTTSPTSASNGILSLEIHPDGTFDVTDLRSNRNYSGLNDFRMDREIGDGWNHVRPVGNRRVCGSSCARVTLVQDGPERTEFEIVRSYEMPRELCFNGTLSEQYAGITESRERVTLEIVTSVALDRGSEILNCRTVVHNNVRDCRLQMLLPTGIAGNCFASQAFTILERPAGRTTGAESETFPEPEMIEKNFDGILGKRDSLGGIALLTRAGIHEGGALDDKQNSLVITLLRAFRRTVQTNGETEGQLPGERPFEYAIAFFPPGRSRTELYETLRELRTPVSTWMLKSADAVNTDSGSFLRITGSLAVTALKPADDGTPGSVILRLVNLEASDHSASIRTAKPLRRVTQCRLDESELGELDPANLNVSARPHEIVTLKLEF